jgi:hypothetical protein
MRLLVIQGNQNMGNATTDHTLTLRLGTFTTQQVTLKKH